MNSTEPLYILEFNDNRYLAATLNFSQFYEVDPNPDLEPRSLPLLPGLKTYNNKLFKFFPIAGHPAPHVSIVGVATSSKSRQVDSSVSNFPSTLRRITQTRPIYLRTDNQYTSGIFEYGQNIIMEGLIFEDLGDYNKDTFITNNIDELIKYVKKQGKKLCTIGGDHSVSYFIIKQFLERIDESIILVIFDAHQDCVYSPYPEKDLNHANFVKFLLEHEKVSGIIQIGVRGIRSISQIYSHPKLIQIPRIKMTVEAIKKAVIELKQKNPNARAYISFDMDCLDPSVFPHVDYPVVDGPSWSEVLICLQAVFQHCPTVIGVDIVEGHGVKEMEEVPTTYQAATQVLINLLEGINLQSK